MNEEVKEGIEEVTGEMEDIINDRDVPSNVKEKIKKAKKMINQEDDEQDLNLTRAIYYMNECCEDINIPFHIRTDIMNITSFLEEIKGKVK